MEVLRLNAIPASAFGHKNGHHRAAVVLQTEYIGQMGCLKGVNLQ